MILTPILAAAPAVQYGWAQASHDLAQILPIVAVVVTLLVAMIVDMAFRPPPGVPLIAGIAGLGLAVSVVLASVRWAQGGGDPAFYGYASGDRFALFFQLLLGILGILTVVISEVHLRRRGYAGSELHVLVLAATAGMMALSAATSLVTVFIGLETLSLALYVACGYARGETTSQEAAAKYLLIGGFASAFVLYGMALVYGASGSTVLTVIGQTLTASDATNPLLVAGILLLAVGFAFKVSGAPFHQWTPDVYQGAPMPVTAFMSVGTKAAAFAMIMRVFGTGLHSLHGEWALVLAFVAACSMIVGNFAAIAQTSVKRLLAYSGVAQAGYILVGVVAGGSAGYGGAMFYLFAYLFMNFGAFAVLSTLTTADREHERLGDLDGLGQRNPLLGVLMTFFMLSLAGFPPTLGFFGKLYLFSPGVATGWTWLVVIAVLTSVVSVAYYLRVVFHVWSPVAEPRPEIRSQASLAAVTVTGIAAVAMSLGSFVVIGAGITAGAVLH
ncbi:MAG: NADH-quinone oxidoreductase subunit N [Candidatus Dormibacteraeota bacterium]|nr:NADH-quinone oxidoreductase subunit N [Candidatus Dormibacteraeota bacterium]